MSASPLTNRSHRIKTRRYGPPRRAGWASISGLVLALAAAAQEPTLRVEDPWVREAPPAAAVLAAYMRIHNDSGQLITLIGIRSPWFEKVELHRTEMDGAVARMLAVDRLSIPPASTIRLEAGGLHAMLIGPQRPLQAGDEVPLELVLDGGARVSLQAEVRKDSASSAEHAHHHH